MLSLGTTAPDFRLLDQTGASLSLAELTGSRGFILLFFASHWLSADRRLLADYAGLSEQFRQDGWNIAAISSTDWEKLHALSRDLALPFPVLFDPCARTSKRYGAMLIPRFVTGRAIFGVSPKGELVVAAQNASPQEIATALRASQ